MKPVCDTYKQAGCTPMMHYSAATDSKTEPVRGHNAIITTETRMSLESQQQLNTCTRTHAANEDLASYDSDLSTYATDTYATGPIATPN